MRIFSTFFHVNVFHVVICFQIRQAKTPDPPPGHKWKEVRHDNTVSWLASWSENILGSTKYIMLNPSSKLKVSFCLLEEDVS